MTNKNFYNFSADVIRGIAIFGVVSIHIANAVYTRVDFFGGITWWLTIILDSFSRISIPLFIMLSGYLILRKDESFPKSLKRILYRIAIPLFFWYAFYVWYGGGLPSLMHFNASIPSKIFIGNMYHLYFLVIMAGLYFIAPIFRPYLKKLTPSSSYFFMKSLLLLGVTIVALQFIFKGCGSETFFTKWIPYSGLFVAGYVLGNRENKFDQKKLLVLYGLSFAVTLGGNYLHYLYTSNNYSLLDAQGCLSHYTDHYLSINVLVMSVSAFLILLNLKYENIKKNILTNKFIHSMAKTSFGIYIIHPFVARYLEMKFQLAIDLSTLPIPVIILSRLILVLTISYIITIIFLKTPIIRRVFGTR